MVNACSNCGHSEHESQGSAYCRNCGNKLVRAGDSRDVCPEERQRAYDILQDAVRRFREVGGRIF